MATTLTPKQLQALSTLTSDAALDGAMGLAQVVQAVFDAINPGHHLQAFYEREHGTGAPVVALGMREVAALLRLQREVAIAQGELADSIAADFVTAQRDLSAALAVAKEAQAIAREAIDELAEWCSGERSLDAKGDVVIGCHDITDDMLMTPREVMQVVEAFTQPESPERSAGAQARRFTPEEMAEARTIISSVDLTLPPASLPDGAPVDPTERDPVEVRTFGVGPISPEAESMRFKPSRTWPFGQPFAVLRRAFKRTGLVPRPSCKVLERKTGIPRSMIRDMWSDALAAEVAEASI